MDNFCQVQNIQQKDLADCFRVCLQKFISLWAQFDFQAI